jgi:thiol:disulfide interchange protein DsbG
MNAKLLSSLLVAALVAGCGKETSSASSSSTAAPAEKGATAVSIEANEAEAKGFTVGSPMSVRTVYVFFDAQCPHCGELWSAAKPLKGQAKFVWMPVRVLNDSSEAQGASILAAADPVATMDEHEALLMARKGGMTAASNIDAQRAIVKKNTELFNKFGFASIPAIVAKHAQTGNLVVKEGAMSTAALAQMLGLQVPGGQ